MDAKVERHLGVVSLVVSPGKLGRMLSVTHEVTRLGRRRPVLAQTIVFVLALGPEFGFGHAACVIYNGVFQRTVKGMSRFIWSSWS